jgi:hypothetical protein
MDHGGTFPLRYVVPPKTDHLPLWSLTQVNPMPKNAPLAAGQHIIVPRHLTAPTEPISSRH